MTFATILTEPDFAEILFLIALILFLIATVMAFQVKTLWAALVAAGLSAVAFGWLAL